MNPGARVLIHQHSNKVAIKSLTADVELLTLDLRYLVLGTPKLPETVSVLAQRKVARAPLNHGTHKCIVFTTTPN